MASLLMHDLSPAEAVLKVIHHRQSLLLGKVVPHLVLQKHIIRGSGSLRRRLYARSSHDHRREHHDTDQHWLLHHRRPLEFPSAPQSSSASASPRDAPRSSVRRAAAAIGG